MGTNSVKMVTKVKTIKNLLSNNLANTNFFTSWNQSPIILDSLAEILAQELPNPSKAFFYPPHEWVIDSAHGVQTISIILDTAFIEFQDNQEEALLKSLNTGIGTEIGQILFTASDIGNTLILITISSVE